MDGRQIRVIWRPPDFVVPSHLVTQASAVCFTVDGKVLLVSKDGENWQLPGGHLEEGETPEEAVVREIEEEACVVVMELGYLGAQEVHDPDDPEGKGVYYQTRFWARVKLKEFRPDFEIVTRKCFAFGEMKSALDWHTTNVLDEIVRRCGEIQNSGAVHF